MNITSSHPFPKGAPQKVYGTTAIFSGGTAIATAATATTRRRTATPAADIWVALSGRFSGRFWGRFSGRICLFLLVPQ